MAIDPDPKDVLDWIRRSLGLLASPAEIQFASLPREVPVADDMALDFDSAWLTRWAAVEAGLIGPDQEDAMAKVDSLLVEMSGPERPWLWTNEALRSRPEWEQVRRSAAAALILLK